MEHMDDIIRAREIIKRKYNALRRGEAETSAALEKLFKPVAKPLKDIARSKDSGHSGLVPTAAVKKEEKWEPRTAKEEKMEDFGDRQEDENTVEDSEKEDEREEEYVEALDELDEEAGSENDTEDIASEEGAPSDKDALLDSYLNGQFGPLVSAYLRGMITNADKEFDHVHGLRVGDNGQWMLGSKVARFDLDDNLSIGDETFASTKGLLELIFKCSPQEYSTGDLEQYKRILQLTNAHRRSYKADKPLRSSRSAKYKGIIRELFRREKPTSKKRKGAGLFVPLETKRTYVYWDDPNELVERLALLAASREAGNTGLEREILSIEEELREGGYIL